MVKVYNTLTRRKEELIPLSGNKINMYACGITVSGDAHIGHAYQALIYDIIRKYLVKRGFDVTYARNYTDVDDKIIAKSKETGIPADKYAAMMIKRIDKVMREFDVDDPDIWLKATCNIDNIIDFIKGLEEKGTPTQRPKATCISPSKNSRPTARSATENRRSVFRRPHRKRRQQEKRAGLCALEVRKRRRNLVGQPVGQRTSRLAYRMFGNEPRGVRRPNRHTRRRPRPYFPASRKRNRAVRGAYRQKFVKYWIHNGLIKVNGQKMSKSLGNSLLLEDLLKSIRRKR